MHPSEEAYQKRLAILKSVLDADLAEGLDASGFSTEIALLLQLIRDVRR